MSSEKIKFSKLLTRKEKLLVFSFFIIAVIVLSYIFFFPNYYNGKEPKFFEIKKDQPVSVIIDNLSKQGIIPNKFNMKVAVFLYGAQSRIKAGRYRLPNGLSYFGLLDAFISGKGDVLKEFKIYNNSTLKWITGKLRNDIFVDTLKFNELSDTKEYQNRFNHVKSLEGYILPDKYFFYEHSSAGEILDTFSTAFNSFFNDTLINRIKNSRYNLHQILTLASIIDGETNIYDEMPVISGVYINRLNRGMRLQADPTIQYLLPNWRRLSYSDLKINSPYNTYRYGGLPPGPIGNPSRQAILAAIFPAKHNYLYFVADTLGRHRFASSYSQHQKYANEYRRWLNSLKK